MYEENDHRAFFWGKVNGTYCLYQFSAEYIFVFYSYEAKYIDKDGLDIVIPAKLPQNIIKKIQDISIHIFAVTSQRGLARVDFFVDGEDVYLNEINTLPGFTPISMYPKLWEASGIPMPKLIDMLIRLAIEIYRKKRSLLRRYER